MHVHRVEDPTTFKESLPTDFLTNHLCHVVNVHDQETYILFNRLHMIEEEWGLAKAKVIPSRVIKEYNRLAISLIPPSTPDGVDTWGFNCS